MIYLFEEKEDRHPDNCGHNPKSAADVQTGIAKDNKKTDFVPPSWIDKQ